MSKRRRAFEKGVFKSGKETYYRGIKFRSRWEVYIAKLLVNSEINFLYEPAKFKLPLGITYIPDFYLPSYKMWIEVKGSLSKRDIVKVHYFSKSHKLLYIGKDEMQHLLDKSVSFASSPDIVNYQPSASEVERFKRLLHETPINRLDASLPS